MKSKFFTIFFLASVLIAPLFVFAETKAVAGASNTNQAGELPAVILFHGEECPHCRDERAFLTELKKELPELKVMEYEVWHNEENKKLFFDIAKKMGVSNSAVPFTIIGEKYMTGFGTAETTGVALKKEILAMRGQEKSAVEKYLSGLNGDVGKIEDKKAESIAGLTDINVPFFGKINIKTISLPLLAGILGTLDGFNPCSMWALLVLLVLLINTGSRKKVWIVGGTFIGISTISYFLFMTAWLNAFVFAGYIPAIRVVVGLVALGAGIISIKEFFDYKPNVCEISTPESQKKTFDKIKEVMSRTSLWAIVLGTAGVAFSVNLVELMCSIGFPVVFTKTLAMYSLPTWKYYFYILLYVFFYMVDDLIVLGVAGFSMKFVQMNDKYAHWSRLFAGILMAILGAIFLIKPELLMFG